MDYASDFKQEQRKLKEILSVIDNEIAHLKIKSKEAAEYFENMLKSYTGDNPEFYTELPIAEKMSDMYKYELESIQKAEINPYFGKIIFSFDTKEDEDNIIYLGKKGISDHNSPQGELHVIDWRTPVADVYYSGKMGKISYTAPEGDVGIELKQKSTLKIRDRELISIYDSEMVLNDELLTDYLSQSKSTVLNEIIATIQEEQNIIIRKNMNTNLIVQGVAGSGKTTVALHRISFLLYNYKDMITFENIYLIAGNKLFLNYITAMLPDLDVPVIKQGIMRDILSEAIKGYSKGFKIPASVENTYSEIYDNETFIDEFDKYIERLEEDIFSPENINVFGFELMSAQQIQYYACQKKLSAAEKAKILDGFMANRVKSYKEKIIGYISDNRRNEDVIKFVGENFGLDCNSIFEVLLDKNYNKFAGKYKKYFSKRAESVKCENEFRAFSGRTDKNYSFNDLACLLLFYLKIKGPVFGTEIKHVVIDEAQDFGIAVYYCLRNLFGESHFTIVGDIMQNINESGLDEWNTMADKVFDPDNTQYEKLLKSYRNTIEISVFAEKLMKYLGRTSFKIQPLLRHGQNVRMYEFESEKNKFHIINDIISTNRCGGELCAIICRDNKTAEKIYPALSNMFNVTLLNIKEEALHQGIYVMSLKNSKGLEFDTVIVWDFDSYIEEGSTIAYNRLYVAITRALHNLHIISNDRDIKELINADA